MPTLRVRSHIIPAVFFITAIVTSCSNPLNEDIQKEYSLLPERVDYNFHIRPILSDRCYSCHGPDPSTRKAGLRLDIEEESFKKLESGKRAFVRGSIAKSEAIRRMLSHDEDKVMPPLESKLSVSNREIALISKWLKQGAKWKEHWSFMPLAEAKIPEINNEWPRHNPIDHFIQAELVSKGMQVSKEADKQRLIKRVTMDLTGLAPSLDEIDKFVEDNTESAYEKLVDRLLSTDAYAERMAMDWMDVARYADSHGISFDGYRTSWPYRDWLINAFKENISYDEFVTKQLAGDLIENSNDQDKIATAFLRMNPMEASAGSIDEEFRIEYVNERASVTGTAFLGLTMECAKCHDHKFDPITQKEFFQMAAFFNNTEEYGLGPTDADRAPTLLLLSDAEKSSLDSLTEELDQLYTKLDSSILFNTNASKYNKTLPTKAADDYIGYFPFDEIKFYKKERKRRKKKPEAKKEYDELKLLDNNKKVEANLQVSLAEGKYKKAAYIDGEYDIIELKEIGEFEYHDAFSISTWVNTSQAPSQSSQTIIGNTGNIFDYNRGWDLAIDSSNRVRLRLIHRLPDEVIHIRSKEKINTNKWYHIAFTYSGSRKASGINIFINGKKVEVDIVDDKLKRSIIPIGENMKPDTLPLWVGRSKRFWDKDFGLFSGSIDDIKIYDRQLSGWEMSLLGEYTLDSDSPNVKTAHWALEDKSLEVLREQIKNTHQEISKILDSAEEQMVMKEMDTPRKTYILDKGLYNQHLEEVEPGGVEKVLPYSEELPKNRLGLAQWLMDEDNTLVSRVAINRYWQMIFGKGLVKSAEDFGSQGTQPSHPELLDWLAADFITNDWDIKHALKQMVMSHTYRQSSTCPEDLRIADPENLLLARAPSYRWPAEMIRDNALKASGLLVDSIGGPSVKPYQPDGLWKEVIMASAKLRKYVADSTGMQYRRSMYTFNRRFAPHPYMITFDATPREICTIRRNITNTPLQALTLLNDPQFIEASRVLSENLKINYPDSVQDQIYNAFMLTTGLEPDSKQLNTLENYYENSLSRINENPLIADSLLTIGRKPFNDELPKEETAAMTLLVSTLFNFDDAYMKR